MRKSAPKTKPGIYVHSGHSEWGHGVVVEENASKIYLSFEDGIRRCFLNVPMYRRFLVKAELPPEEADALIAEATRITKPGTRKTAGKKTPAKKTATRRTTTKSAAARKTVTKAPEVAEAAAPTA
jgi:hypothetical protein